jgi:peptidoglycan hydrolase CwlO-like protein
MGSHSRISTLRHALALATVAALAALAAFSASAGHARAADPLPGLQSALGAQQARQQTLAGSIASLDATIGSLDRQVALVQGREASVRAALAREQAALARVRGQLVADRGRLAVLRRRLAQARTLLGAQLRSGYESQKPSLVNVVLAADGFQNLLTQLSFLGRAENEQQRLITFTATAKREATQVAARLVSLRADDARIAHGSQIEARALAGMNSLLDAKQAAVARARAAQAQALAASRSASVRLRSRIAAVRAAQRAAAAARAARIRAAQAAAAAAAAARSAAGAGSTTGNGSGGSGSSGRSGAGAGSTAPAGGSGGWAIPEPIVMCESGGQNLPPNSAGASGYYQIIPGTWRLFGGSGPAAWLAPLAEQSAVAARIWNGGAGASNWVCAGIVGIH